MLKIANDLFYVGVYDNKIDYFEGMYNVPEGVSYNSYIIKDEKIAVVDSVDSHFGEEWLSNVEKVLAGAAPDYLIVQHMEPDHSACVKAFAEKYPEAQIVGNQKTFVMLGEYFGENFPANRYTVKDGDGLNLGKHQLKFVFAPMVHWPEVMLTYDMSDETLFSADAFGKFGPLIADEKWKEEARRYYIGIVGKYGVQVTAALKKLSGLVVERIAPLHGPCLEGEIMAEALDLYGKWSGYKPEFENGILIACSSVYGHTMEAARLLQDELKNRGVEAKLVDLVRHDWADCVALAFAYPKLVIASTTYNADIFPAAREFINRLVERNYQNRVVAFMENGTWAPVSAKLMAAKLEGCKNLTFAENTVKIRSALSAESRSQISALADELSK